ncbi:peptidyl-prolyl cis-trans isomerase [Peribacillus alkalitolerans]|uniref:peptidyl-prolyl cis-trans isomerase n=1 Tax=Peribacillus alkalitolerans TaxID=1550385 RepID=UPI0013D299A7|nr:peptidyl-prolyl cis-trans isomerase [Peribacillus alkalitolerans]
MTNKRLWSTVIGLILLNVMTILLFAIKPFASDKVFHSDDQQDVVATIGKETISQQEWINELEHRYGKEVLKEMIDEKVILETAKKYDVTVSDQELDREFILLKTMYGSFDQQQLENEEKWRMQLKTSILLEKLLTKDVDIPEKTIKKYYEDNKKTFEVPETLHLSHIVVKQKAEAQKVVDELKDGATFSLLAMEKSVDDFTSNHGGDIGFISAANERYPNEYFQQASKLGKGKWSNIIKVENGYAILYLHERIKPKKYSYDDVKDQIRRQVAMDQMEQPASPDFFWDEQKVDWYYGK